MHVAVFYIINIAVPNRWIQKMCYWAAETKTAQQNTLISSFDGFIIYIAGDIYSLSGSRARGGSSRGVPASSSAPWDLGWTAGIRARTSLRLRLHARWLASGPRIPRGTRQSMCAIGPTARGWASVTV